MTEVSAPDAGSLRTTEPAAPSRLVRKANRPWRSIVFAPVGDGQTRRRGSDAFRLGTATVVVLVCWLITRANSNTEHTIATTMSSPPEGLKWLVSAIWWVASIGVIALIVGLALLSRRWSAVRDIALSGALSAVVCLVLGQLLGTTGGRPPDPSFHFDLSFPVARVAATVGVAVAALPYLSRWLQRTIEVAIGLLALAAVVNGSGLPVSILASIALGWGRDGARPSHRGLAPRPPVDRRGGRPPRRPRHRRRGRGPGSRSGVGRGPVHRPSSTDSEVDVSVYGRDASDAQLLAKTVRFLFYRDSGPTLALTRRQQVEHEAYLTLMAARAGTRVPAVLAPARPARPTMRCW